MLLTNLLMYARPFFKYFTMHALQGKEKKNVLTKAGAIFCGPYMLFHGKVCLVEESGSSPFSL